MTWNYNAHGLGILRTHAQTFTASGGSGEHVDWYDNEDRSVHIACLPTRRRSSRHSIPSVYHYCKLSCLASRMAIQQGVESNQIFLNACVLLDGL